MPGYFSIGKLTDFQPGRICPLQVEGQPVCIVRLGERVHAVAGYCTHEYVDLSYGYVMGGEIICGQHEAGFDIETGEVTRGPAEFDLRVYPVKVEDGEVFLSTEE